MYHDNIILKVYLFSEFNFQKGWGENSVKFWVSFILKMCCSAELNVFKKAHFISKITHLAINCIYFRIQCVIRNGI